MDESMLSDQKDGDAHCGMFFSPFSKCIDFHRNERLDERHSGIVRLIITAFVLCIVISHLNSKDTPKKKQHACFHIHPLPGLTWISI